MKKFVTGVIIMSILSILTGCGINAKPAPTESDNSKPVKKIVNVFNKLTSNDAITIDYAELPTNFMIQLEPDQKYILKNNDVCTDFSAQTHALLKHNQILTYGDLTSDLSRAVYYRKTEPVLIHYNDKDYIWICEQNKEGMLISASFFYLTEYHSFGSDNGTVNVAIGDAVLDPADYIMKKSINCFGSAVATVHYEINENGKPEELQDDSEYYYIDEPYSKETLCLDDDIHTWVYANSNAKKESVKEVAAGTTFHRFRVPKNAEYQYVDAILDDGKVFRVIEEYWFSEPTAYQAMMDKDANQFQYHSLDSTASE